MGRAGLNCEVGIGNGADVCFAMFGATLHFHVLFDTVKIDIEIGYVEDIMKVDKVTLRCVCNGAFAFDGRFCRTVA